MNHGDLLANVNIVLVEPQVPGNIGATARAMKNMGLHRLVLVNPWFRNHPQARYMAHGSLDILDGARYCDTLDEAVADSVFVVGVSRRTRKNMRLANPRETAEEALSYARSGPVSLLFGREDKGLSNEELTACHVLTSIPSSEAQPSLNLSQAVMVLAYEFYTTARPLTAETLDYAAESELAVMYSHLRESLTKLGFKQWNDGDNYIQSLRRVFSRTGMERRDVAAVHKLCGEIDKYTARLRDEYEKGGGS